MARCIESEAAHPRHSLPFGQTLYVWARTLTERKAVAAGAILRTYYYTSAQGDYPSLDQMADELERVGIEAPRIFKKEEGRRSKRVDISLSTDMLTHAARHHYDIAVLVAGDEDYVPLVEAVQAEGRRVYVWSLPNGLSPVLNRVADAFTYLSPYLLPETS